MHMPKSLPFVVFIEFKCAKLYQTDMRIYPFRNHTWNITVTIGLGDFVKCHGFVKILCLEIVIFLKDVLSESCEK